MGRYAGFLGLATCVLFGAAIAYGDGLDAAYGKGLPDFNFKGKSYKILRQGNLAGGDEIKISNVLFEPNAKALLVGVGQGDGSDLDMVVLDGANNQKIGEDTLLDNVPVVEWQTGANTKRSVHVRLVNSGKAGCKFVLLANW